MEKLKKKIEFYDLAAKNTDFNYWMSKTPQERIYALEHLRNQYLIHKDGTRQRLQRVFSFTKHE